MQFKPIPVQLQDKWVVLRKEETGWGEHRLRGEAARVLGDAGPVALPLQSLECAHPAWSEVGCWPSGKGFCVLTSPVSSVEHISSVPFIYFLNEIHFQMLLVNVWMPSAVLGMSEWRTRKWEQGLALVSLDASSMKASKPGAKGWDGAKCLAQFTGGTFSQEYATLEQQKFAVKIDGPF